MSDIRPGSAALRALAGATPRQRRRYSKLAPPIPVYGKGGAGQPGKSDPAFGKLGKPAASAPSSLGRKGEGRVGPDRVKTGDENQASQVCKGKKKWMEGNRARVRKPCEGEKHSWLVKLRAGSTC